MSSQELLEVKMSHLEDVEGELEKWSKRKKEDEKREMVLLLASLNPKSPKWNADSERTLAQLTQTIVGIDRKIKAKEKELNSINEDLQQSINSHFNWQNLPS